MTPRTPDPEPAEAAGATSAAPGRRVSRRDLLTGGVAATVGAATASAAWAAASAASADRPASADVGAPPGDESAGEPGLVPFHGPHQAGIATPLQALVTLLAFDLRPGVDRSALQRLLRIWTDDAARLASGRAPLADLEPELAEVPARLTATIGFGPGLLAAAGRSDVRPAWLAPLPAFDVDRLEDRWSGGDLVVQLGADDPTALAHAARTMARNARAFAEQRWVQRGFAHAPGSRPGQTPRNLMGQVDGTVNPRAPEELDRLVWAHGPDVPDWLQGGTGMVVRRIRMDLDTWEALDRPAREQVVGRRLATGAPLTGGSEHDDPDLDAVGVDGLRVIAPWAHVRRARGSATGPQFLRRGVNYDDGPDDAGQVFVAFSSDPAATVVPVQRRLAELDLLNDWTTPVGSAVFAVPPGCEPGDWIGRLLLE